MSESEVVNLAKKLSRTKPFDYNYHNRIGENAPGLYSFWVRGCCLYVGQSMDMKTRLWQHRKDETNSNLARYRRAFPEEIEISHVILDNVDKKTLEDIEARVICHMDPKTNIQNK